MPQLCAAAYGCLKGMWLPTLGHCCLSSIVYIVDRHYLDMISINAVIIDTHLCSHSKHHVVVPYERPRILARHCVPQPDRLVLCVMLRSTLSGYKGKSPAFGQPAWMLRALSAS
jgi:hypothetical protein